MILQDFMIKNFFSHTRVCPWSWSKRRRRKKGMSTRVKKKIACSPFAHPWGLKGLFLVECKDQRIWSCCHGVIWGEYDHHSLVLVKKIFSFEIYEVLWWLQWDQTLKLSNFMRVYLWHKISEMGPAEYCFHAEKLISATSLRLEKENKSILLF